MLSPSLFIFIKDKILDKSPSHFIDAANRFSNMYTYEQETIITHSLLEASIASFRSALHVTTLYAKRVIDQSYILLSVNKTIVRCQNWVIVDLVHKRAAPKQPARSLERRIPPPVPARLGLFFLDDISRKLHHPSFHLFLILFRPSPPPPPSLSPSWSRRLKRFQR